MIPDVPYRFIIPPLAEDEVGRYLIEFPDLPVCLSDGETIEAAIMGGLDAMRGWTLAMRAEGHPIPAPTAPRRHERLADGALGRSIRESPVCVCTPTFGSPPNDWSSRPSAIRLW